MKDERLDLRASYETALGKKGGDNREYFKRCLSLLEGQSKKFPAYHVSLHVTNGVGSFTYRKRDLQSEKVLKRVDAILRKFNPRRDVLLEKIDKTLSRVEKNLNRKR